MGTPFAALFEKNKEQLRDIVGDFDQGEQNSGYDRELGRNVKSVRKAFKNLYSNRRTSGALAFVITDDVVKILYGEKAKSTIMPLPGNVKYKEDMSCIEAALLRANGGVIVTDQGYLELKGKEIWLYTEDPKLIPTEEFSGEISSEELQPPYENSDENFGNCSEEVHENVVEETIRQVNSEEVLEQLKAEKASDDAKQALSEINSREILETEEISEEPEGVSESSEEALTMIAQESQNEVDIVRPEENTTEEYAEVDKSSENKVWTPDQIIDALRDFLDSLHPSGWNENLRSRIVRRFVDIIKSVGICVGVDTDLMKCAVDNQNLITTDYEKYIFILGNELASRKVNATSYESDRIVNRMVDELDHLYISTK